MNQSVFQPWIVLYRIPHDSTHPAPYIYTCMAEDAAHALDQLTDAEPDAIVVKFVPGNQCGYSVNAFIRGDSPDRNDPAVLEKVRECFADFIAHETKMHPKPRGAWTVLYQIEGEHAERTPHAFVCEADSYAEALLEFEAVFPEHWEPGARNVLVRDGHERHSAIAEYPASRAAAA